MKIPLLKNLLPRLDSVFWLSAVVVGVLFLAFLVWGDDGLLRLWGLQDLRHTVREENKAILLENLSYAEAIESLKLSGTVETIARGELGLIRQDEVILVVPPAQAVKSKIAP